jgi:hypothetical protein
VDRDHNLAVFRREGDYELGDNSAMLDALAAHPDFRKGLNSLFDYRAARPGKIRKSEIAQLSGHAPRFDAAVGPGKSAGVVACDLAYGFLRMFMTLSEMVLGRKAARRERDVFRNLDDALRRLGLPADYHYPFDDAADD